MDAFVSALGEALALVGPLWLAAWIGALAVLSLEAGAPRPAPGQRRSALALASLAAGLALPFLLFVHGFSRFVLRNQDGVFVGAPALTLLIALAGLVGVLVIVPSLFGPLLRALGLAWAFAPLTHWLTLAVFAFALWISWADLFTVLDLFASARSG